MYWHDIGEKVRHHELHRWEMHALSAVGALLLAAAFLVTFLR